MLFILLARPRRIPQLAAKIGIFRVLPLYLRVFRWKVEQENSSPLGKSVGCKSPSRYNNFST